MTDPITEAVEGMFATIDSVALRHKLRRKKTLCKTCGGTGELRYGTGEGGTFRPCPVCNSKEQVNV